MSNKHFHRHLEIYYLESGVGRCIIDDKLFFLQPKDIMIIPPGAIHQSTYSSPTRARFLLSVSDEYIPLIALSLTKTGGFVFRNERLAESLLAWLKLIFNDYSSPDQFSDELIKNYLYAFFATLHRNPNLYSSEKQFSLHVQKAIAYVNQSFCSEITVSDLAARVSISREHLSRLFKTETGINILQYLTNVRIRHAEEMLTSTRKSITEIAFDCGFNDSNYFSFVFKKTNGIAPLAYRKSNQRK